MYYKFFRNDDVVYVGSTWVVSSERGSISAVSKGKKGKSYYYKPIKYIVFSRIHKAFEADDGTDSLVVSARRHTYMHEADSFNLGYTSC